MLTLDIILKDTMWVGKFEFGGRITGTYADLEPMMDEFRDFDVSCSQPSHLKKFYEDYFAYNDTSGWITIPDYYNNVYVREVA